MLGRRAFISVLGGSAILAASGGLWAATRDPSGARRPWIDPGTGESEARRRALSYAILAPNPHNRQPWIADLSVPDVITLFCAADRRLPETDPFDRQITVGLGAFLELLGQAAAETGWRTTVTLFPEGEPQPRLDGRPVAQIRFSAHPGVERDPLFMHVLARRTNREPFDISRSVEKDRLARVAAAAKTGTVAFTNEPERVSQLRSRAWAAMLLETSTYATAKETVDLLRIGRAEIEANPDGVSLAGPLLEGLSHVGLLRREEMLDPNSSTYQQQVKALKPPFDTAMAFLWLATKGNTRADQIRAGRDYVRLNLAATAPGLRMQPFSQALQEFPAMAPHYDGMRTALGIGVDETLQMFVRVGYGPDTKPSPRWPAATRIRAI